MRIAPPDRATDDNRKKEDNVPQELKSPPVKRDLKQDHFVTTTSHGLAWASENRKSVIVTVSLLLAVIVVAVVAGVLLNARSHEADSAFSQAMEIYQAPVDLPGQPQTPGVKSYPTVADRAKAANDRFRVVADKYGFFKDGKTARYFEGLTYLEEGQTQSAESILKTVAGSWNGELASLGKFALADLYRQTGRTQQAIDLYNQLTAKPTDSVPAGMAQIQLAELYTVQGKTDQARKIYAQLKDKDAKGAAGILAAKKLNPGAAEPPQL